MELKEGLIVCRDTGEVIGNPFNGIERRFGHEFKERRSSEENPFNGIERLRYDDHRFWRDKGGSIAVVALTSDAMVKEVRSRVGPKVNWAHMWNLDYVSTGGASEEVEHRC